MNDSGSGAPGGATDLEMLPAEISRQSLSSAAIILPADAAQAAIAHLSTRGRRLECWEGWVKLNDGGRTKSLAHSGSFALPSDAVRAADVASAGIKKAQARWDRDPEYPGAALYVELTFGRV